MKIFNLESKSALIIWSLISGLVIDFVCYFLAVTKAPSDLPAGSWGINLNFYAGFPLRVFYHPVNDSWSYIVPADGKGLLLFLFNLFFWFAVGFILLSSIKHFKSKN